MENHLGSSNPSTTISSSAISADEEEGEEDEDEEDDEVIRIISKVRYITHHKIYIMMNVRLGI